MPADVGSESQKEMLMLEAGAQPDAVVRLILTYPLELGGPTSDSDNDATENLCGEHMHGWQCRDHGLHPSSLSDA